MKTSYVCTILIVLCSCISNNELETRSNVSDYVNVNSDLVNAFDHLNEKIGNGDLSIENQKKLFFNYAVSRKVALNLNNASCSTQGKGVSLPGVSKAHQKIIADDIELLNSYRISCISGYGCIGGQCVQDGSYVPPSCPYGGFWNGFECVYP